MDRDFKWSNLHPCSLQVSMECFWKSDKHITKTYKYTCTHTFTYSQLLWKFSTVFTWWIIISFLYFFYYMIFLFFNLKSYQYVMKHIYGKSLYLLSFCIHKNVSLRPSNANFNQLDVCFWSFSFSSKIRLNQPHCLLVFTIVNDKSETNQVFLSM